MENNSEQDLSALPKEAIKRWSNSLEKESDRGVVLVTIAVLDDMLTMRLKNIFKKGNSEARERLLKSALGVLSGFSSKVDICFCLGIIPQHIYKDIRLLNKLRNKCAHEYETFKITDDVVNEYIEPMFMARALRSAKHNPEIKYSLLDGKTPRDIYLFVMSAFIPILNMYVSNYGLDKSENN